MLVCVASVSVGFSARSRHFSLFGGAKIGASTTLFCASPKFRAFKKIKMLQTCGKPYGEACYAGYSHADKTHFHVKGCALGLALKKRHKTTRKWSISEPMALHVRSKF